MVVNSTGLRCDQTVALIGFYTAQHYPGKLRRIKYYDAQTDRQFLFLTNNFSLPALTITQLYRYRCQVKLFFRWIKQHPRIKSFSGTSESAIIKKRLNIKARLYSVLQILSLTVFETTPMNQLLTVCEQRLHCTRKHSPPSGPSVLSGE